MTPVVVLVSWLVLVQGQVVAPSPSPPPAHNQTRGRGRGRGRGAVTRRSGVAPHRAECGWVCGDECFVADMICDSFEQCDDNSDEGRAPHQGCNLFPESGCWSHRGRRHYKVRSVLSNILPITQACYLDNVVSTFQCDRTGECFPSAHEAAACEAGGSSSQRPSRSCQVAGAEAGWRCGDGRCISALQV